MSKYHENCTKDDLEKTNKCRGCPPLTGKPFCDCHYCKCKDCPDILKLLCITVTENSCDFGSKVAKSVKKATCSQCQEVERSSLLDVLSPERDCTCETMARAVRSHLHMNIGMSERRSAMKVEIKPSTEELAPKK